MIVRKGSVMWTSPFTGIVMTVLPATTLTGSGSMVMTLGRRMHRQCKLSGLHQGTLVDTVVVMLKLLRGPVTAPPCPCCTARAGEAIVCEEGEQVISIIRRAWGCTICAIGVRAAAAYSALACVACEISM